MQTLISENIYEEVNITDYQAVCKMNINDGNPANILQTVILCALHFAHNDHFPILFLFIFFVCDYFAAISLCFKINQMDDKIDCVGNYTNLTTTGQCE